MPAPLNQYAATEKPGLYIEVKLLSPAEESENRHTNAIRHEVLQWLDATFEQVQIGEYLSLRRSPSMRHPRPSLFSPHSILINVLEFLSCAEQVSSVRVTGRSIPDTGKFYHRIADHNLDVTVFSLFQDQHDGASSCLDGEEDSPFFTVMQLPHQELDGRWESLVYSEPVPENILRVLTEMIEISSHANLNAAIISWYSIVLLHGPPGSGKTTLAESLAQKLSIRMRHMFSVAKMFHLKCSTLFSSYFSESSKQIGKLFDIIGAKASDKSLLTVVIIDEVETLASSRQRATQANEAMDSMRVGPFANRVQSTYCSLPACSQRSHYKASSYVHIYPIFASSSNLARIHSLKNTDGDFRLRMSFYEALTGFANAQMLSSSAQAT
jgi:hypothetical protein